MKEGVARVFVSFSSAARRDFSVRLTADLTVALNPSVFFMGRKSGNVESVWGVTIVLEGGQMLW